MNFYKMSLYTPIWRTRLCTIIMEIVVFTLIRRPPRRRIDWSVEVSDFFYSNLFIFRVNVWGLFLILYWHQFVLAFSSSGSRTCTDCLSSLFLRNLRDPVDLEEKLGRHKGFYWLYFAPRLSIEFLWRYQRLVFCMFFEKKGALYNNDDYDDN